MKKIALILTLFLFSSTLMVAQSDKIDRLADQIAENNRQIAELNKQIVESAKQQAIVNAEFAKQLAVIGTELKNLDKRFDVQTMYIMILFTGILGLMALVVWDRRAATKPFEDKTEKIQLEVALIKERELKLEERELRLEEKVEASFKKIAQIDARFAGI